jgi:hypothetical protein
MPQLNHDMDDQTSPSALATHSINAIAFTRILVGGSLLILPRMTSPFFGIPLTSQTVVLARLFGSRDLVLGGLLWSTASRAVSSASSSSSLGFTGVGGGWDHVGGIKSLLVAGLVVDGLDVCSCLFGVLDGTIKGRTIPWIGGGAAAFVGLGLLGLTGL